ncbi:MAG: T9SS type A sorting domain-containing protein [Flavobacteriales bacterium]
MKSNKPILFLLGAILCNAAAGQGESLRALTGRYVPQAENAMRKVDGLNTWFLYDYDSAFLPIMDDFSVDRTRKRWSQPDDADVTLIETIYRLEVAGVSEPDMVFATDTTFFYTTDMTDTSTTRVALPAVEVTVRDLTVYVPTEEVMTGWPPYNLYDTLQSPSIDTLDVSSSLLVQDSLMVYSVAVDQGTYVMPDGTVVPLVLWEDDDVYVNGTYPIEPPTVGVATFDGLARTGYPYNFPVYSSHGIADHLTSVPIHLDLPASDSIYLSFFYQPQGLSGDNNVQPQDSLVLEFYAPDEQTWYRVWRTQYLPLQDFQQVLVPITLERYLHDDFQFRFLNYATLSGSFDHWHLDYVRLGAQRTFDDTRLVDVAYMYPESSLLETYTSVPFNKFAQAPASYMAQSVAVLQRNLDIDDRFITYGMDVGLDGGGGEESFLNGTNTSGNAETIFASDHPINSGANNFEYDPTLSTDFAFWNVEFWTNATPDINRYNDTTRFTQELSNYYAYDDGSAEMGYGLNSSGAIAYRFDMVGGDSLRAVRMYFNPQANAPPMGNPLTGTFLITVWTSLSPAFILHQNFTPSSPNYRVDGINHFVEYPLDSTIYVQGTFYIGWVQTEGVNMNLGFDRNRNNQNKIFKNTTGTFSNTSFQGSLMMRPVFVAAVDPFAGVEEGPSTRIGPELMVYPNPALDAFTVRIDGVHDGGAMLVLLDATGRVVMQERYNAGGVIATGDLADGVYVLRAMDRTGSPISQARLIIQH